MATAVTPEAVEKVVFDALPQFGADPSDITRESTSARSRPSATRSTWW